MSDCQGATATSWSASFAASRPPCRRGTCAPAGVLSRSGQGSRVGCRLRHAPGQAAAAASVDCRDSRTGGTQPLVRAHTRGWIAHLSLQRIPGALHAPAIHQDGWRRQTAHQKRHFKGTLWAQVIYARCVPDAAPPGGASASASTKAYRSPSVGDGDRILRSVRRLVLTSAPLRLRRSRDDGRHRHLSSCAAARACSPGALQLRPARSCRASKATGNRSMRARHSRPRRCRPCRSPSRSMGACTRCRSTHTHDLARCIARALAAPRAPRRVATMGSAALALRARQRPAHQQLPHAGRDARRRRGRGDRGPRQTGNLHPMQAAFVGDGFQCGYARRARSALPSARSPRSRQACRAMSASTSTLPRGPTAGKSANA